MGIILNALCIFVFTRCHRRGASGAPGTPIIQIYLVKKYFQLKKLQ
jgi:hypothetical protein